MKIWCSAYTTGIVISRRLLTGRRSFMNTTTTAFEYRTLDLKSDATELGVCEKAFQRRVRRKLLLKLPGFAAHDTQIFDRDSYDLLFAPLENLTNEQIDCLKGLWNSDIASMILLRVLPELDHQRQIVTSGTVIELALKDQEFIEVHLAQRIRPEDVDQIVESPETAAMEARILERQRNGLPNHMHELEWVRRRTEVVRRLEREGIRHRVVTQHGRGFQWR